MHTFKIRPNGFNEIRKALLVRIVTGTIAGVAVASLFLLLTSDGHESTETLVSIGIVTIGGVVSDVFSVKRQKKMYDTYTLTITEEHITRQTFNTPDLTIPRNSVKEIVRAKNGALIIAGESELNNILVPHVIEQAEEVERLLSQIKPITIKPHAQRKVALMIILFIGAMFLLCWGVLSENIYWVTLSGLGLCAFLVCGFVMIQRSKNYDRRMKRWSYVALFPIVCILAWVVMSWLEGG